MKIIGCWLVLALVLHVAFVMAFGYRGYAEVDASWSVAYKIGFLGGQYLVPAFISWVIVAAWSWSRFAASALSSE